MLRRLAISLAATSAMVLGATAPALAVETVSLQEDQAPTTAEEFQPGDQECDDQFDALGLDDTKDGWHFVAPGPDNGFISLELTFTDLDDEEVVVEIDSVDPNTDTGEGWAGYFTEVGNDDDVRHAWVVTEAGWTLTGGTAEVESGTFFNLSHTCPGEPGDGKDDEDDDGKDDEDGKDDDEEDKDEDEKPESKPSETPAAVPTEVPAGSSGSNGGSMAPVGVVAVAMIAVAGAAALLRRRFSVQS